MSNSTISCSIMIEQRKTTTLLKYLVEKVSTGTTVFGSLRTSEKGVNKLIQSKNISNNKLTVSPLYLEKTDWGADSNGQYLTHDTIVVYSRGIQPIANVFLGKEEDKTVINNTFFIVNLLDSAKEWLRPKYVAWYINHANEAKRHFELNARGSNLIMTNIQTLRELPIFIPSIKEQDQIVNEFVQMNRDIEVMTRMIELRREHNQAKSAKILQAS